jgi:hypothetical protein
MDAPFADEPLGRAERQRRNADRGAAEGCARTLLISTNVWSGDRPRRVAGRIASVASVTDERGKSTDGATVARAWPSSVVPCCLRLLAERTSTGAAVSSLERPGARVPVTTISSPDGGAFASALDCGVGADIGAAPFFWSAPAVGPAGVCVAGCAAAAVAHIIAIAKAAAVAARRPRRDWKCVVEPSLR